MNVLTLFVTLVCGPKLKKSRGIIKLFQIVVCYVVGMYMIVLGNVWSEKEGFTFGEKCRMF